MSKTVVISDIHLRHKYIDYILKWEEPYDKVIFLGDQFDQFGDLPQQNREAAIWVKAKLKDPRNFFIFGNHDWSYRFSNNREAYCSGFDFKKSVAINEILQEDDWNKFKGFHFEHDILFSHAGIDRDIIYWMARCGYEVPQSITKLEIIPWLNKIWPDVLLRYRADRSHYLMGAGNNRGGDQKIGGIIWQDFGSHMPIPGLNQIVGHTPLKYPFFIIMDKDQVPTAKVTELLKSSDLNKGWTLGIDTHNKHYVVINDNILSIETVIWERSMGMSKDDYIIRKPNMFNEKGEKIKSFFEIDLKEIK